MKVLIVDDSIVFRTAIKTSLLASEHVTEVDVAANGKIALEKIQQNHYDGVTLDLEMPVMDGVESIKEIRKFNTDIPIIIFSAQSVKAANKTLEALRLGANDFVQKITGSSDVSKNLKMIENELVPRFNAMITQRKNASIPITVSSMKNETRIDDYRPGIVCVASSTGGPEALMTIFKSLKKLRVPMVIVQHIPPIFSTQLSIALNKIGENEVCEAKNGDVLAPGKCYLAPGDYHMTVNKNGVDQYIISLNQDEKVCYVRPSADVLFNSVAKSFTGDIAGVVLTGMGSDGAIGSKSIKEKLGKVIVQDQSSCIVWGMPGATVELKAYDEISDLNRIIEIINKIAS